jgi:hypothetical protein
LAAFRSSNFPAQENRGGEATNAEFVKLFEDAAAKRIYYGNFDNPSIRRALESFSRSLKGARMSESDLNNARRGLFSELRRAALGDTNAFDLRTAYDYFRRAIEKERRCATKSAVLSRTPSSPRDTDGVYE